MKQKVRIRKNDQVVVLAGKDRGKKGRVMQVYPKQNSVLVEKVNYKKVAQRRTQSNPQGGVVQMEKPIPISNVQLICPTSGKPTRIGLKYLADGTKQRYSKKSQEIIGS